MWYKSIMLKKVGSHITLKSDQRKKLEVVVKYSTAGKKAYKR